MLRENLPSALGSALGDSITVGSSGSGYDEAAFSAQEDARDATMARLLGADPAPALSAAQMQAMALGYGPLTPEAATRAVVVLGPGGDDEFADGAAQVDKMGQPLSGRSNYNASAQFGKIMSEVGKDSLGTTASRLWDWATYTTPDAAQRAAEIRGQYGSDARFSQLDQMRDSPLGAIFWLGAMTGGASVEAQKMWLDIGTAADGLAMSGAALTGGAPAFTGVRSMPELVGEPKLFARYEATRASFEHEMFGTPNDELSGVISRDTGELLSRQLVPGVRGTLNAEMLSNMEGNTFTHFHPSGGNFSLSDIRTGLASGAAELRAVMDGRTVSLNFENAPAGLLNDPAEVMKFMSSEGRATFNAITTATQQGLLPQQGTPAANIQISDFAVRTFVERNPWVKYTETKNPH